MMVVLVAESIIGHANRILVGGLIYGRSIATTEGPKSLSNRYQTLRAGPVSHVQEFQTALHGQSPHERSDASILSMLTKH